MSATDERLAIWRYATPEERQRVIDADWEFIWGLDTWTAVANGTECCPWGIALPALRRPDATMTAGMPMAGDVTRVLLARGYSVNRAAILGDAMNFMAAWDDGNIPPDVLVDHLRRLNAQEAAADGQATVLVALGAWLALLAALALVSACAFAAQWATDLWTLGHIAGGW